MHPFLDTAAVTPCPTSRSGPAAAVLALVALLALGLPTRAQASCTALGVVSCTVTVSATALPFGNYNASSGGNKDVSNTLTVSSTIYGAGLLTTLAYTISLDGGGSGNVADRRMTGGSGGPALAYNLYTGNAYGTIWGSNTVSDSYTALATVLGTSVVRNYTVYGRIPGGQYVSPGGYADTVIVTVDY